MRKILLILIIVSFLIAGFAEAVALKVRPSEIKIETNLGILAKEEMIIENPGGNVALFEVYLDDFSDWIKIKPESFILESGESQKVILEIKNEERGIFSTMISVVARPLSERKFKANSGVKIPLEVRSTEREKIPFLAAISQNLIDFLKSKISIYILGIILVFTLAVIWIQRKKKKLLDQEKFFQTLIAIIFVLIGVSLRLLPHPPNFAPILAIALFGGVYLSRKIALILPIVAMVISDIFIGYYEFSLMFSVYGSFLLCVILGFWLKRHKKWYTIGGSAIISAILFFLITNFAVWVFTPWYAKTLSGILQCYLMALPFFKNTLLGNLFYVSCFFGAYEIVKVWVRKKFTILKELPIILK